MVKYAEDEKLKGNIGPIAKKIIMNTGKPNTMFKFLKYALYNIRIKEVEDIYTSYNF
jgi:hypothetical protein